MSSKAIGDQKLVSDEHASYPSSEGSYCNTVGVGLTIAGAGILLGAALYWVNPAVGRIALVGIVPAWIAASIWANGRYRRKASGASSSIAVERDLVYEARRGSQIWILQGVVATFVLVLTALKVNVGGMPNWLGPLLMVGCIATAAILALRFGGGPWTRTGPFSFLLLVAMGGIFSIRPGGAAGLFAVLGVGLAFRGGIEHRQFLKDYGRGGAKRITPPA
jgi:hypothetical protein